MPSWLSFGFETNCDGRAPIIDGVTCEGKPVRFPAGKGRWGFSYPVLSFEPDQIPIRGPRGIMSIQRYNENGIPFHETARVANLPSEVERGHFSNGQPSALVLPGDHFFNHRYS